MVRLYREGAAGGPLARVILLPSSQTWLRRGLRVLFSLSHRLLAPFPGAGKSAYPRCSQRLLAKPSKSKCYRRNLDCTPARREWRLSCVKFGLTDDVQDSDGGSIFDFAQAQRVAQAWWTMKVSVELVGLQL